MTKIRNEMETNWKGVNNCVRLWSTTDGAHEVSAKKKQSLHSKWQFNTNQSKMTRNQVNGWITVFEHFCIKNRSTTIQLSNIVAITNCTIRSILPLPRKLWHNSTPIMLAIIVHVFHLSEEIASPHQNGTKRHVPWDHQYFINFMNFRNAAPQISWYMVFFSGISWNNFAEEKHTNTISSSIQNVSAYSMSALLLINYKKS